MRVWQGRLLAVSLLLTLLLSGVPSVAANPAVPYCDVASLGGGLSGGGALTDPELCETKTGRVFPEALADSDYLVADGPRGFKCSESGPCTGFVDDYVGFFEFQAGLDYLSNKFPDYIEVHEVAMSNGYPNSLGPESNPIYILEITNENSPMAREDKLNLLFMLSIHGNEKGGREGGFRVLEDLLKDIGFASETVQNGAGIPGGLMTPAGTQVETYHDYLDFMSIFLLFPNTDGWVCDEVEYAGGGCPGLFNRGNSGGTDLNRQTPTIGWHNPGRNVLGEPEAGGNGEFPGFANWLVQQKDAPHNLTWNYAIDIHGMLTHQNFGAIMLPAGSFSPQEMHRSLRLAETLKERWNLDSESGGHFEEWATAFQVAETAWEQEPGLCEMGFPCPDLPLVGSPLHSGPGVVSSSQFAEYYTVIDAIGYTDSGFNGDFFAQTTGLNAPGYDIELAYNHMNCGAQYQTGVCAQFNDYHVWMVRHIVKSFMDAAALDVKISYETAGQKTAYVVPQYVATNADDVDADNNPMLTPGGWADQTSNDDAWDYGADQIFQARPAKYWEDIAPFICEDCASASAVPGTLSPINPSAQNVDNLVNTLANHDVLVIPNTAINQFIDGAWGANEIAMGEVDHAKIDAVMAWINNGGTLVLTDAALEFFDLAGITTNAVEKETAYMGGVRMDLDHPLLEKVRGGVKQTYEPTPLGWGTSGDAPLWGIKPSAFAAIPGNSPAGLVCGGSRLNQDCSTKNIALGEVAMGAGKIRFMGAILPDPTEEFYHPYGLDNYATTYSGNQVIRNLLGWDEVFAAPPIVITGDGKVVQTENERESPIVEGAGDEDANDKGAPGVAFVVLVVALAGMVRFRRK